VAAVRLRAVPHRRGQARSPLLHSPDVEHGTLRGAIPRIKGRQMATMPSKGSSLRGLLQPRIIRWNPPIPTPASSQVELASAACWHG
jgi:hypothetical protein